MSNALTPIIFISVGLIMLLMNKLITNFIIEANIGKNNELGLSARHLRTVKFLVNFIVVFLALAITAFGCAGFFIPIKY